MGPLGIPLDLEEVLMAFGTFTARMWPGIGSALVFPWPYGVDITRIQYMCLRRLYIRFAERVEVGESVQRRERRV